MKGKMTLAAIAATALVGCDNVQEELQIPTLGYEDSVAVCLDEGEQISDVAPAFGAEDLDGLDSSVLSSRNGGVEVIQRLWTGDQPAPSASIIHDRDERDRLGHFLFYDTDDVLFRFGLKFNNDFESEIGLNGELVDLVGQSVAILGERYKIVRANLGGTDAYLQFMSGAMNNILDVGHTGSYSIDGTDYVVSLAGWNPVDKEAGYIVNGEWTGVLGPGKMYQLADGTNIGHVTMYDAGGIQLSEFMLGANSMLWRDENITDTIAGQAVPVHDFEYIEEAYVRIEGTIPPGNIVLLHTVDYTLMADAVLGDLYVPAGEEVSAHLDEPEGIPGRLGFGYAGKVVGESQQSFDDPFGSGMLRDSYGGLGINKHIVEFFIRD